MPTKANARAHAHTHTRTFETVSNVLPNAASVQRWLLPHDGDVSVEPVVVVLVHRYAVQHHLQTRVPRYEITTKNERLLAPTRCWRAPIFSCMLWRLKQTGYHRVLSCFCRQNKRKNTEATPLPTTRVTTAKTELRAADKARQVRKRRLLMPRAKGRLNFRA